MPETEKPSAVPNRPVRPSGGSAYWGPKQFLLAGRSLYVSSCGFGFASNCFEFKHWPVEIWHLRWFFPPIFAWVSLVNTLLVHLKIGPQTNPKGTLAIRIRHRPEDRGRVLGPSAAPIKSDHLWVLPTRQGVIPGIQRVHMVQALPKRHLDLAQKRKAYYMFAHVTVNKSAR